MKAVVLIGGDRGEGDARHPVDGRLEFLVRDSRELAADDDVADRQQAARLDLAQSADREDHRRLHLDREHAAR
jgi:hypothetical protein